MRGQALAQLGGKFVGLVSLLIGVAWYAKDPGFEAALAAFGGLSLLVGLEYHDQLLLLGAEDVAHDREMFEKYETMMPEQGVRNQLEGPLYNHYTSRAFLDQMDEFLSLASTEAGDFLDPQVQARFEPYVQKLAALRGFIVYSFFPLNAHPDRYELYPELRHEHGTKGADLYDSKANELAALNDEVEASLKAFRAVVKRRLKR